METILSLLSLQTAPHRIFLALKSPRWINGRGNCVISFIRSAGDIGTAVGK
jgi:hypothetical protein